LILRKICFTLKNGWQVGFPGEKKPAGSGRGRKTIFVKESKTIADGLGKYGIGAKLRRLRLRKSMGLQELSRHTGLSPALLSKLERDVMHPTLPTLLRIAMVFSVGLDYFFVPEPKPVLEIVRKSERMRFPDSPDAKPLAYYFESLDFPVPRPALNAYLAEFEPVEEKARRPHEHAGVEFLYLMSGRLRIQVGGEQHELAEGDAIYFDASVPHSYSRIGPNKATALVATTGQ
jgi:transcriptional regulator with XRE-family HTH domain